jgi:hypothetical protein
VPFDLLDAWDELEERSNFRKWFQSFASPDLHYFTWDFTSEVTRPRSIILVVWWSIWRHLGGRSNYLGFQASRGCTIPWSEARSMPLRGILEI